MVPVALMHRFFSGALWSFPTLSRKWGKIFCTLWGIKTMPPSPPPPPPTKIIIYFVSVICDN